MGETFQAEQKPGPQRPPHRQPSMPATQSQFSGAWDSHAAEFYRAFPPLQGQLTYGPLVAGENDLKLLGPVDGKRVLDLGCGAGFGSVALAKGGAHVTGVDFSESRLEIARKLAEREEVKVEFRRAGLAELIFIPADTVDVVVCCWALNFVPDWARVFRAVSRVLVSGGTFVLSIEHPFWSAMDRASGTFVGPYADGSRSSRELIPGSPDSALDFYSYTVSGVVSLLMREGFSIQQLLELPASAPPTDPWYRVYPPSLVQALPPVLVVKCGA